MRAVMVELGRRLGNHIGLGRPLRIANPFPGGLLELKFLTDSNQIEIFPNDPLRSGKNWHFFLNRQRVGRAGLDRTSHQIMPLTEARQVVEVLTSGPLNSEEEEQILIKYLLEKLGDRVFLQWEAPDTPVSNYKIFGSPTPGPLPLLGEVPGSQLFFVSDSLVAGTYQFRVNPVDAAGNELTSALIVALVVPGNIDPPQDPVTFSLIDPTIGRINWLASATPGIDFYRIYANNGAGFVNLSTPWATVSGATLFAQSAINAGDWIFIVRAVKDGIETSNFDRRVEVLLSGSPLSVVAGLPNTVSFLSAGAIVGGTLEINVSYDTKGQAAKAAAINLYVTAAPGPPSFAVPTETILIPDHKLTANLIFNCTQNIGPLFEDTYLIVARVEDDLGNEETLGVQVIAANDTIPPDDITDLEAEVL